MARRSRASKTKNWDDYEVKESESRFIEFPNDMPSPARAEWVINSIGTSEKLYPLDDERVGNLTIVIDDDDGTQSVRVCNEDDQTSELHHDYLSEYNSWEIVDTYTHPNETDVESEEWRFEENEVTIGNLFDGDIILDKREEMVTLGSDFMDANEFRDTLDEISENLEKEGF